MEVRPGAESADISARVRAPDGSVGLLSIEAKNRLEPKGVPDVAARGRELAARAKPATLVAASAYLGPSTRERLRSFGLGFIDLTGNVLVSMSRPGLFIEAAGATRSPDRESRPARSLRGTKTGRIVRALVDRRSPPGVRELASMTGTDAGYVSRVLAFLDSEALVTRGKRGRIETVAWPRLLRRWAAESPLDSRGTIRRYLEPRGLPPFLDDLRRTQGPYAVSGGLAAARLAPIAPPRLALVWARPGSVDPAALGLRPADSGANVFVVEPEDDAVFEGVTESNGLRFAAASQVAADLLTSPGRGPAEGDALLAWMERNEDAWRG